MALSNQLNSSGKIVTFGGLAFDSSVGLIGTNGATSAAAGSVGQIVSDLRTPAMALSVTNAVITTVVSVVLTPGQWQISGAARVAFSAVGLAFSCGISTVSGVMPDAPMSATINMSTATIGNCSITAPTLTITIASPVTVSMSTASYFSSGTAAVCGYLTALRVR